MNSSQAISIIYASVLQAEGPIEARRYISTIINNVIDDLQIDSLPVTPENIEKGLCEKAVAYKDTKDEEVA